MPEYQELIPKMNFRINDSGVIVSPPLEDMYPFLEKNELKQQMIIPLIDE